MSKTLRKMLTALSVAAVMVFAAGKAEAAPVPVSLVLAIDASGSISGPEYILQRNAYASVLGGALISITGEIAIGVVEFGQNVQTVFGLTVIDSQADKDALVAAINAMNRTGIATGATAIGDAVNAAQAMLAASGHAVDNRVIDVSTDGFNNTGANPSTATGAANAAGTVVNCLAIGANASCGFMNIASNLALGGFSVAAPDFAAFEDALEQKIAQETGQVPEPGLLALAGLGLVGLVARRRRNRR